MHRVGLPARAHRVAALTLAAGADTKVPIDTLDFDPGGLADTAHYFGGSSAQLATNTNRYICPTAGFYAVYGQVRVAATASGQNIRAIIRQNAANDAAGSMVWSSAAGDMASSVTDIVQCLFGDTIELWANSNAALALSSLNANNNFLVVQLVA